MVRIDAMNNTSLRSLFKIYLNNDRLKRRPKTEVFIIGYARMNS